MTTRDPCLVVVNQTIGSGFSDWLVRLAGEYGPVDLWTGNPPTQPLPGVAVRRAPAYDRSSVGSRLRTWLLFTLVTLSGLFRYRSHVPVFVVTNPPFAPLAAWLVHKLQRRPYGLLEWDIYPHILAPMGLLSPNHPMFRLWRTWHGRALSSADLVVTIGEQMADILRHMARQPGLPVTVIPTWVNADTICPPPCSDNPFVRQHKLNDRLVVLYSGNLGATHAIETILDVAERLREVDIIEFLVVGEGAKRVLVEAAIEAGQVPNLRLLPRQPMSQLPFVLSSAHVGVVTLAAGYEGLSMPSKTYDLMAAGAAILGISRPPNDLEAAIVRHKCGANFPPESTVAIADWILGMTTDPDTLIQLRTASRAASQSYSADRCQVQLSNALRQTLLR